MERRLPVGPLLAGIGAVIMAVTLFVDWWDGVTPFEAYELLDLVLLGLALLTIISLAGGLGIMPTAVSPVVSLLVAVVTVVIVLSQIVNDPPAIAGSARGHEPGIWVALVGAALMVIGTLLAYARISLALDVRPREPRPGGGERRGGDDAPTVREPGRPARPEDPERL